MIKRICFFAGFNKTGRIAEYVYYYLEQIAKFADVFYYADGILAEEDKQRLQPYCKGIGASIHGEYDFGSWKRILQTVGERTLADYDELILCNDSCFGPLADLSPLLNQASQDQSCDFWGFSSSIYNNRSFLSTYFVVFKKNILTSGLLPKYLLKVQKQSSSLDVVLNYEIPFTFYLQDAGFRPKVALCIKDDDVYFSWKNFVLAGLPFIKIKVFTQPQKATQPTLFYQNFLKRYRSAYPASLISKHLNNLNVKTTGYSHYISYLHVYLLKIKNKLFRMHLGNPCIIRLFGCTLINTQKIQYIPVLKLKY